MEDFYKKYLRLSRELDKNDHNYLRVIEKEFRNVDSNIQAYELTEKLIRKICIYFMPIVIKNFDPDNDNILNSENKIKTIFKFSQKDLSKMFNKILNESLIDYVEFCKSDVFKAEKERSK